MSAALRLHRSSRGFDPAALVPGRDLVLDPAPEHGLALPVGTVVDDLLDDGARADADAEALEGLARWIARRAPELTLDGIHLGWAWEVELLASCFLPAARLRRALAASGAASVRVASHEPHLAAVLAEAGADVGAEADVRAEAPVRERPSWPGRALERFGVPARVRGGVLAVSYWHMEPVWRALTGAGDAWPVAAGLLVPGLDRAGALRTAWRGGWSGHPSSAARRRSDERIGAVLDGLDARDAVDAWALAVLRSRAGATLAQAEHWRRILRDPVRVVVVPFDSPPEQRVQLAVAREAGIPSVLLQHGYDAQLNDPDKTVADHIAVWSEHDRAHLTGRVPGTVRVTGNPGAEHLASWAAGASPGGPVVVLVEYPSRISARIDARISLRHVDAALALVERERPGTVVVVRPHPADRTPEAYLALAARRDVRMTVDTTTPIEPLLQGASACVGALSTATLQSAALGRPTLFLDLTAAPRPWPFDGRPDSLPRADDVRSARLPPSAAVEAARDALGARPGATDAVVALVRSVATGS